MHFNMKNILKSNYNYTFKYEKKRVDFELLGFIFNSLFFFL